MAKLPFFSKSNLPDLGALSLEELTALHTHVGKHLVDRKEARIKELQAELKSLGAVSDSTFVGNGKPAAKVSRKTETTDGPILVGRGKQAKVGDGNKTRAKPPVKYKDDKGNAWTGRGATPKWLAAYVAAGKNKDDFLA